MFVITKEENGKIKWFFPTININGLFIFQDFDGAFMNLKANAGKFKRVLLWVLAFLLFDGIMSQDMSLILWEYWEIISKHVYFVLMNDVNIFFSIAQKNKWLAINISEMHLKTQM